MLLGLLLSARASVELLPRRVVLNASSDPICPIACFVLLKTVYFVICVAKLAAGQIHDFNREMVSDAVNVVRQFLRISVHFVLRLRLGTSQWGIIDDGAIVADRDDMDVEVTLATLLLAPFCELWMSGWDETKSFGGI
jgi:hypothetical protein